MKIRYFLFVVMVLCCSTFVQAQVRDDGKGPVDDKISNESDQKLDKSNYKTRLSLGVGVGFSNLFGDLNTSVIAPAGRIGLGIRVTPFLVCGIEAFGGQLSSKQAATSWTTSGFNETSTFESVDLNAKVSIGNYIQNSENPIIKLLSGIYIGSGIGFVNNNINSFYGKFSTNDAKETKYLNNNLADGVYTKKNVITTYVPLNLGIRIHLKEFFGTKNTQLMLNYQINYTFSDYMDGYSFFTSTAKNKSNDAYTVITFGLSFHITRN